MTSLPGVRGLCARLYHALAERMNPGEVDRLELWQAAVMLGRDQQTSVRSLEAQLRANEERARVERAQRQAGGQVASRPRVVRAV